MKSNTATYNTQSKLQIRKLTGKAARDYREKVDSMNVYLKTSPISHFFWESRAKTLEAVGVELNSLDQRHRYTPQSKRLLDLMYIYIYEGKLPNQIPHTATNHAWYKYLRFRYRRELNYKHEWVSITEREAEDPIYIWHEDYDRYIASLDKQKSDKLNSK